MTEAAAAKEAGLSTVIVVREGNAALTDEDKIAFTTIESFLDLKFQTSVKRQKLETVDEKADERTIDVGEAASTSEDVEMSDVSEKKDEKNETKETNESEAMECTTSEPSEKASTFSAQKEEPMMVAKEVSNAKQETPISEMTESNVKSEDTNEKLASESTEQTATADVATLAKKDSDNIAVSEKTEENTNATEVTPTVDSTADTSIQKSVAKSEVASTSAEKKTDEPMDIAEDAQSEITDKTQKAESAEKVDDVEPESQISDKTAVDKPEECITAKKDEVKEELKISGASEKEEVSTKDEQEKVATTEVTAANVTENGDVTKTDVEKTTESEATVSTIDTKKEASQSAEVFSEKNLETAAESEKTEEKPPQNVESEEVLATDAVKCDEATKQEVTINETVKEENIVDVKGKTTVDSEKQKLNGTAQNGDTDVPVLDDKLHSNGLNEGPSKEISKEDATAQNGEAESSSESSAESIKVKKVVDPSVADGPGEPDVVPPVVVATS